MRYKHTTKKDLSCYSYTYCRKPETTFDGLCRALKGVAGRRRELKRDLNNTRKYLATETKYSKVASAMGHIQYCHRELAKYYELMIRMRHDYVDIITKFPELKKRKIK